MDLSEYTFTACHRPGSQHGLPDGLSRFPLPGDNVFFDDPSPAQIYGTWIGPSADRIVIINSVMSTVTHGLSSTTTETDECVRGLLLRDLLKLETRAGNTRYVYSPTLAAALTGEVPSRPRRVRKPIEYLAAEQAESEGIRMQRADPKHGSRWASYGGQVAPPRRTQRTRVPTAIVVPARTLPGRSLVKSVHFAPGGTLTESHVVDRVPDIHLSSGARAAQVARNRAEVRLSMGTKDQVVRNRDDI